MSELPDVTGGDTITSARNNTVKERTVMRYASAAARNASIPAPVEGSLAFLQDQNIITYYDGTVWQTVLIAPAVDGEWFRLDGANNPITGAVTVTGGDVTVQKNDAIYKFRSPDGQIGYDIWAVVQDGFNGGLIIRRSDGEQLMEFKADDSVHIVPTVLSGMRNVIQSTVAPTTEGQDGDLYVHYSAGAATTGADVYVKVAGVWRGQT